MLLSKPIKRALQITLLSLAIVGLMAAGGDAGRFQWLGHRMICVCGCGQILLECNHVGCEYSDRMRSELMSLLDRGESDISIRQLFVQKYSSTVFAGPTNSGFNRLAWITPFLALLLGMVTIARIVREWKDRPAAACSRGLVPEVTQSELEAFRRRAREETDL
jgi:cytochrome c-type biogenesis protein CcmH